MIERIDKVTTEWYRGLEWYSVIINATKQSIVPTIIVPAQTGKTPPIFMNPTTREDIDGLARVISRRTLREQNDRHWTREQMKRIQQLIPVVLRFVVIHNWNGEMKDHAHWHLVKSRRVRIDERAASERLTLAT